MDELKTEFPEFAGKEEDKHPAGDQKPNQE
jgi:hypothetical protein